MEFLYLYIYIIGLVVSCFLVKSNERIRSSIKKFDEELRPIAMGFVLIWPLVTICIVSYWLGYAFYKFMMLDKLGST